MHSLDIQCLFVRLSILSTGTHPQQIWVSPHPDSQYIRSIRSILPKHFASRIFKICLRTSGLLHSFSAHGGVMLCHIHRVSQVFFMRKMRTLFRSCLKRDIMDAYWIQSADGGSCCVHPVSCVSGKQSRLIIGFAELAGESNSCSSVIEATATTCSYWYH